MGVAWRSADGQNNELETIDVKPSAAEMMLNEVRRSHFKTQSCLLLVLRG
jgi:hypothetical protein